MTLLLTQMAIVLLITVACGWLALKVGQARVIGEIIGGILVGPSVFGRFAPHLSAKIFPVSSFGAFRNPLHCRPGAVPVSNRNGT